MPAVTRRSGLRTSAVVGWVLMAMPVAVGGAEATIDLSKYDPACTVKATKANGRLVVQWSDAGDDRYVVKFNSTSGSPLLEEVGVSHGTETPRTLLRDVEPAYYVSVGSREKPRGSSPQFDYVFFDNPAKRPHETFRSALDLKTITAVSSSQRLVVTVGDLTIGSFRGALDFTFYSGSALVKIEAAVKTEETNRAIVYDAGLVGLGEPCTQVGYRDTDGRWRSEKFAADLDDAPLKARHRTVVVDSERTGSVAVFPPPHQFFYPRDYTDNQSVVWRGRNHAGFGDKFGIGIRQTATGGGNFVPWNDAPAGTNQRLAMFLRLSTSKADSAAGEVLRYTHIDRFPKVEGHTTFTSHYHMAIAETAMRRSNTERDAVPQFVEVFRNMGVQMVHLGEFHGDGHQKDPGPLRLPEMEVMFRECRQLSDDKLLFIPGEEVNEWLGKAEPGKHPGHWMSLFPKPVYWIQKRTEDQPFVTQDPKYGKVYRVGSRDDMTRLIAAEKGLVWSAHPRIKASSWAPDAFKDEEFFKDPSWLGGAWKAMPMNLAETSIGRRGLDLLDDMSNWGAKKYLPGEVDVFKIDRTHELYGHMNINYLRLPQVPRYDDGWQPVLDALSRGAFYTTTGEMHIRNFNVGGAESGQTVELRKGAYAIVEFELTWTFPPHYAYLFMGTGDNVVILPLDLSDQPEFGSKKFGMAFELGQYKWLRVEAWDVAANGVYTQPVWIEEPKE